MSEIKHDLSLEDLDHSEQMLKESLLTVGEMAGLNPEQIESDWEQIKRDAAIKDIHIEEL
ncbi:MAG: hypothetical protein ICV63_01600 [Coleofasciculus sp. Co-bin14]|nr:hypothetical protein [Coleofasciculus sp. Co-bin14]